MSFGEKVKAIRKSKGLTLEQVTKGNDITIPYLSMIENDKRIELTDKTIRSLSVGLNVNFIELMISAGRIEEKEVMEYCRQKR